MTKGKSSTQKGWQTVPQCHTNIIYLRWQWQLPNIFEDFFYFVEKIIFLEYENIIMSEHFLKIWK